MRPQLLTHAWAWATGLRMPVGSLVPATICLACVALSAGAHAAPTLPDGRAYERVTPADKNGADIQIAASARASVDGNRATYYSFGNFGGGGAAGGFRNQLLSSRGLDGWDTRGINPPLDSHGLAGMTGIGYRAPAFSDHLRRGISISQTAEENQVSPVINLFLYDDVTASFTALTRPLVPIPAEFEFPPSPRSGFGGASRDFSRIVFNSHRGLTADPPLPSEDRFLRVYIYQWHAGDLRLINMLPPEEGGGPALASVEVGNASQLVESAYAGDRPVSHDGSRIFWQTINSGELPVADPGLYMWQDSDLEGPAPAVTVRVDASERTDCAGDPSCGDDGLPDPAPGDPAPSAFNLASDDGRVAFFTSTEQLTDDSNACGGACGGNGPSGASADLYRWDAEALAGQRLTNLTPVAGGGDVPDDNAPNGSPVSAVVGSSLDGSRVYFVSFADLAPGGVDDQPNLYRWDESGGTTHVATLDGSPGPFEVPDLADIAVWIRALNVGPASPRFRDVRVTSDGRYVLLRSRAQLTTYDTANTYQIYLYDAEHDEIECVSCNPQALQSTDSAYLKRSSPDDQPPPYHPRNLSDDGRRVFFDSREALVPEDTNGRFDVYEWVDGQLHLISTGQSAEDSAFVDASTAGDDIFFTTRQRLVESDGDNLVDLYDARVGGGFPEPPAATACVDDACQGPLSAAPVLAEPASGRLVGPGDPVARRRETSFSLRRLTRSQRMALARGRAVGLRVRVGGRGTVRAVARARLGGRRRVVARASGRAAGSGAVRLRLRLSRAALSYLSRSPRLRVSVSVRFSGAREPRRMALGLTARMAGTSKKTARRGGAAAGMSGKGR